VQLQDCRSRFLTTSALAGDRDDQLPDGRASVDAEADVCVRRPLLLDRDIRPHRPRCGAMRLGPGSTLDEAHSLDPSLRASISRPWR